MSEYHVRLCDISSTRWRRGETVHAAGEFHLTEHFQSFYDEFDEIPILLAQALYGPDAVTVRPVDGSAAKDSLRVFTRVEVVLFSLTFPADQIVAAVVLDLASSELSDEPDSLLRQLLTACVDGRLLIRGRPITAVVDDLARQVKAVAEVPADPDEDPTDAIRERHALVMVRRNNASAERDSVPPPDKEVIAGILYGIQRPYRQEFIRLLEPAALNREGTASAAVTQNTSFLYGHQRVIENSVLLTTVQAVGTAARFQRIWRDAYYHVRNFQTKRQARTAGMQTRQDLEILADELGNLELDLAFSVQTAADMGLGSATARIDDFHDALYEVMEIKRRADTVGQMFVRLGGSLGSELTAIESREKEIDERYRLRGAITLGVLSFILAPVGILLAFFGINASQVDEHDSIFNWDRYLPAYLLVGGILLLALTLAGILPLLRQWSRRRRSADRLRVHSRRSRRRR